jgi:hypothetical protein
MREHLEKVLERVQTIKENKIQIRIRSETMKKISTMVVLMTLAIATVAVAAYGPTYSLKDGAKGEISILKPVQFNSDSTVYEPSDMKVGYTVTKSINRKLLDLDKDEKGRYYKNEDGKYATKWYNGTGKTNFDLAHVYFTAKDTTRMALFVDVDSDSTSELRIDTKLNITDYGIYLYENNDPKAGISQYITLYGAGHDYEITEGTNFGVYYTADTDYYVKNPTFDPNNADLSKTGIDKVVREDTFGKTYTTDENWVASYDGQKPGNHDVVADMNWYTNVNLKTDAAIFCMFQGPFSADLPAFLEWQHVEFGFVTTSTASGQPLPGTLATILISGLCAATLRKRSKKH